MPLYHPRTGSSLTGQYFPGLGGKDEGMWFQFSFPGGCMETGCTFLECVGSLAWRLATWSGAGREVRACRSTHTETRAPQPAGQPAHPHSMLQAWWLAEFPPAACWITARSAYTDTPLLWVEHCLLCSDQALTRTLLWQLTKGGRRKSLIKSDVLRWEVSGMQKKKVSGYSHKEIICQCNFCVPSWLD